MFRFLEGSERPMQKGNPVNGFLAGLLNTLISCIYLTFQHDPCLIWDERKQCLSDRSQGQGSPIPQLVRVTGPRKTKRSACPSRTGGQL